MAERVYPSSSKVDMGSPIQFSGINWDNVATNMKNNRFAQDSTPQIMELISKLSEKSPEEIEGLIDEANEMFGGASTDTMSGPMDESHDMGSGMGEDHGMDSDMDEDHGMDSEGPGESTEMSEMVPEPPEDRAHDDMDSPNLDVSPDGESQDSDPDFEGTKGFGDGPGGDVDEDEDKMPFNKMSGNKTMKKFAFTHPDQISAEAIEKATAEGNIPLVNAIKSARKANRLRLAQALTKKMASETTKNVVTASTEPVMEFTSPKDFTQSQRLAFNKIAMSLGMPKGYVQAMTAPIVSEEVVALNTKIKEVYCSNISDEVKAKVVTSLVKEAALSPDSKSEFINFWNNVLGYQDKDFWPMVAADYVDGKKVK